MIIYYINNILKPSHFVGEDQQQKLHPHLNIIYYIINPINYPTTLV